MALSEYLHGADLGGKFPGVCESLTWPNLLNPSKSAKTQSLVSLPDCSHQKRAFCFEAMDIELEKRIKSMVSPQTILLLIFLQEN